jgi:hypothetical protein
MPWLLDEDFALKEKLSGYAVRNYPDGRQKNIAVYFRFPDPEERTRSFPHIAIDLVSVEFDAERAHRAMNFIIPTQETATPANGFVLSSDDMPLPWTLVYQLAAYSRIPTDDRQLATFLYMQFPQQFGQLNMANFDGTQRRADLLSVVRRDTVDSSQKRLYRNIFTVGVSSEFTLEQIQQIQLTTSAVTSVTDGVIVTDRVVTT